MITLESSISRDVGLSLVLSLPCQRDKSAEEVSLTSPQDELNTPFESLSISHSPAPLLPTPRAIPLKHRCPRSCYTCSD